MMNKSVLDFLLRPGSIGFFGFLIFYLTFAHDILTGNLVLTHDAQHWYGVFAYFILSLSNEVTPLWDPYSLNGTPFYFSNNMTGNLDPSVFFLVPLVKYLSISVLKLYHWNYIGKLLFCWWGIYLLYARISGDKVSSALAAALSFLLVVPNSLWQNGAMLPVIYGPWIVWSFIQAVDVDRNQMSRNRYWTLTYFFVGISIHQYLPSYTYIFVVLVVVLFIATHTHRWLVIANIGRDIISRRGFLNLVLLLVLVAPLLYSFFQLQQPYGDYFNFHRARMLVPAESSALATDTSLKVMQSVGIVPSTVHNFFGMFFPSFDTRYFVDTTRRTLQLTEHFLTLGSAGLFLFILSMVTSLKRKIYWIFFIPFVYVTAMIYAPNGSRLSDILGLMPTASAIHITYNFIFYSYICLGGIWLAGITWLRNAATKELKRRGLIAVVITVVIQALVTYFYLSNVGKGGVWGTTTVSREFFAWSLEEASEGGFWFLLFIGCMGVGFMSSRPYIRRWSFILSVVVCASSVVISLHKVKPYVLQPGAEWHQGFIHYARDFHYVDQRVPVLPLFADTQGYTASLYRIPASSAVESNPYNALTRRTYDYLRFVSHDKQKVLSGLEGDRFGFFTNYTKVESVEDALMQIQEMSRAELQRTVLLEGDGFQFPDVVANSRVVINEPRLEPIGAKEPWTTYYERRLDLKLDKELAITNGGFVSDINNIGKYHFVLAPELTNFYKIFSYMPNLSLIFTSEDTFCYRRVHDWYLRSVRTQFYPKLIGGPIEQCDLQIQGNKVKTSEDLRSPFVTNELGDAAVVDQTPKTITYFSTQDGESSLPTNDAIIDVRKFRPNQVVFSIVTTKPGLFYYADSYSSDWIATINGNATKIYPSNVAFKSVFLPTGTHEVEFRFEPTEYQFLFWLFAATSSLLVCLFLVFIARRRYGSRS